MAGARKGAGFIFLNLTTAETPLFQSQFRRTPSSSDSRLSRKFRRQDNMSPRLHTISRAVVAAAVLATAPLALVPPALAQDVDLEMRIQRLENQLRQLTGQNEERLRQLGAAPPGAPGAQPPAQPNVAAAPPAQANPGYGQPAYPQQGGYQQPQPGYPAQ